MNFGVDQEKLSGNINRFGLSRHIPAEVARIVRRHCGFGCVVCGGAVYDYEHLDPEFKDARSHDPAGIILLCPNHHRAKGGFISRETLQRSAKSPYCKSKGFSHTHMDVEHLKSEIGPFIIENTNTVLEFKYNFTIQEVAFTSCRMAWLPVIAIAQNVKAIWFNPPEEAGAPLRLNAIINGSSGKRIAWIENNVWHGSADNFDIQLTTGREQSSFLIRDKAHSIILDMKFRPPREVTITRFVSFYNNNKIEIYKDKSGGYLVRDGRVLLRASDIYICETNTALSI